jgi:hypothetical protein
MAKKCIPTGGLFGGAICVENMTLFILVLLSISVFYLYYKQFGDRKTTTTNLIINTPATPVDSGSTLQNIYVPPLNTVDVRGPVQLPSTPSVATLGLGLPVNIQTSSANTSYRQIGILTKNTNGGANGRGGTDPLILPLFGRNLLNGRDKWQYYTMANSGGVAFNAKLPISVNGRSCTSEYGCDSVSNGDTVYVEGYNDTFRATIYENAALNYIPL